MHEPVGPGAPPTRRRSAPPLEDRTPAPAMLACVGATALFMEGLDSTAIVTALPAMGASFQTSAVALSLGLTVYMLAAAALMPASGWIADRLGARTVFCAAVALFTLASVLCGASQTLLEFVAARLLQGLGGALMVPVARLVLLQRTPKAELVRMINLMTVPGLLGPVVGPALGGLLTTYWGWRWIFFVNVPVGLVGIAMVLLYVPREKVADRAPFDTGGFVLNALALGLLLIGMDRLASSVTLGAAMLVGGLLLTAAAIRHYARSSHPLIDLGPTQVPSFMVATGWAGSLFRISFSAPMFLLPLLLQLGFGFSALASGLLILAQMCADVASKFGVSRLMRRLGFRRVLIASCMAYAAAMTGVVLYGRGTPPWLILPPLLLAGVARSLQLSALSGVQFADIPAGQMTAASTLASLSLPVTRAFAVAASALFLGVAAHLRADEIGPPGFAELRVALLSASLLSLCALPWYFALRRDAGALTSGHRIRPA